MLRRGHVTAKRRIPEAMRPISGWSPLGAATEGQPQVAASRMGVGPLHSIDEVAEGDEVMEKRGRQEGITTEQAKGRTQRWHPLLPNLRRVNEAAWPDTVHGTAAPRRRARESVPAAAAVPGWIG